MNKEQVSHSTNSKRIDISIIIVNYNTSGEIEKCIDSIYKYEAGISIEIIVIDNNSAERTIQEKIKKYPLIKFIQNEDNIGFGAACNKAFLFANGRYILFLNPDTYFYNNILSILFKYMEEKENDLNIGCLGIELTNSKGDLVGSYGDFISKKNFIYKYSRGTILKKFPFGFFKKKYEKNLKASYKKTNYGRIVDYVTGADLMISRELFKEIGMFDQQFFMYTEEVDLQYRLNKLGKNNIIMDLKGIVHSDGKSFNNKNVRRIMNCISDLKFLKKHYNVNYSVKVMLIIIVLIDFIPIRAYKFRDNLKFLMSVFKCKYL